MKYITKTFTFDGKRYYVRGKTEAEAYEKRALMRASFESGKKVVSSNMTVEAWAIKCIEIYKTAAKENTRKSFYDTVQRYILNQIGDMPIKNVKPMHCQNVLNGVSHLSQYIINQTNIAMNFIFNKAVQNKLISENPAINLVKPKGTKTKRRALTQEEETIFLKAVQADKRFILFELMYHCGCRPSEAITALGSDICEIEGAHLLHVRGTKTENADRFVPIPNIFYEKIKHTPKSTNIAVNSANKKFDSSSYKRVWKSLKREMNIIMGCKVYRNQLIPPLPLAEDLAPYNLRHTYCTNLQKKEVDLRDAQYLMGHADVTMTANIYTHNNQSSAISVAKKINGVAQDVAQYPSIVEITK